jgi:hypothetical protein
MTSSKLLVLLEAATLSGLHEEEVWEGRAVSLRVVVCPKGKGVSAKQVVAGS